MNWRPWQAVVQICTHTQWGYQLWLLRERGARGSNAMPVVMPSTITNAWAALEDDGWGTHTTSWRGKGVDDALPLALHSLTHKLLATAWEKRGTVHRLSHTADPQYTPLVYHRHVTTAIATAATTTTRIPYTRNSTSAQTPAAENKAGGSLQKGWRQRAIGVRSRPGFLLRGRRADIQRECVLLLYVTVPGCHRHHCWC